MARLPRLIVPHQVHHVIQQGNGGQAIFREDEDYTVFLGWLREAAKQFAVAVHAYALLPDRLHLLLTPADEEGLGRMMQWTGRHYVPWFNRKYQRNGSLWQGRFKAGVIDAMQYFLLCSRFIEQSPVLAGIVGDAGEYSWSSYAHHMGIRPDPLITDHRLYWELGNTPFDREMAYKQLMEQALTSEQSRILEQAALKGWAIGSEDFKRKLEKQAGRRVSPLPKGRPGRLRRSAKSVKPQ